MARRALPRAQDDLTHPVDLAAATQFNAFYVDLVRKVADSPATHYLPNSFFHRFEIGD